ncbi:MAG: sigma-70 family RNA polymerase sigma factor [Candidatus Eisenbacteria bacterium]|nr:sigma-70 family RNA polymerase sigma factor [Candidatus Eisenbacteria bacterium]
MTLGAARVRIQSVGRPIETRDDVQDWQQFEPEIARIAAKLTPDEMLQQDLAQEMRIDIWRAPEGKPHGWYLSSARWSALKFMTRTAIDCPDEDLDRQVVFYGVLGDVDPEVLRTIPVEWHEILLTSPIEMEEQAFALSLEVNEAMSLLTRRQQEIAYALAQGFTQAEVAEALSVSRRTIANELVKIRAALRDVEESLYPRAS